MIASAKSIRPAFLSSAAARSLPLRAALVLASTLLIAACAHVALPLWFTPVPLTMQPLAVLCTGLLLGPVDGGIALCLYVVEGAAGLPVFATTGPGGLAQLFGPTGGYLLSYPLVAVVAGSIVRALQRLSRFVAAMLAGTAASVLLFAAGSLWLMTLSHLSADRVFTAAVLPFLPGGVVHVLVAAGIYRATAQPARIG